jgi:raffinose/stachyose/melibiose transport system permease protein
MILLAMITLAPFLYFISLSLSSYADTYNVFLWPKGFEWQNYVQAWQNINVGIHYRNSLYVTALALTLNLLIGAMAAYAFARLRIIGKEYLFNLFIAGLILSGESLLIPLYISARSFDILNKWWTLPIVYTAIGLPFTILILRAFYETIPSEIVDAAIIDGCSTFQLFRLIMLPLSKSALLTAGLFQFVWIWDEFILAISLVTDEKLKTLPGALAKFMGEYFIDYPVLAAAMVVILIPVLVVYILTQKQLVRGMTMGAIK